MKGCLGRLGEGPEQHAADDHRQERALGERRAVDEEGRERERAGGEADQEDAGEEGKAARHGDQEREEQREAVEPPDEIDAERRDPGHALDDGGHAHRTDRQPETDEKRQRQQGREQTALFYF